MHKKFIQIGAGKIGRSFVGPLFLHGGYDVVFVDIKPDLVQNLLEKQQYRIIIKHTALPDETIWVKGFRTIDGNSSERVAEEIVDADIVGTSVVASELPTVYPEIALGLQKRLERGNTRPLDILIAENMRHGAQHFRKGLMALLPGDYDFDRYVGLVEASIGKLVPPMTHQDLQADPLWLFAESFNTLIADRHGFKNPAPDFKGFRSVENISAHVDHKLLLFNMSHAATAYFAYRHNPKLVYMHKAIEIPELRQRVTRCMKQSALALHRAYPEEFTLSDLHVFSEELFVRFQNKALGDTIARVGRDIRRKLHKNDRLVGAMMLAKKHDCPCDAIAEAVIAACEFRAADEDGQRYQGDIAFSEQNYPQGLEHILTHVCQLSRNEPLEAAIIEEILNSYRNKE